MALNPGRARLRRLFALLVFAIIVDTASGCQAPTAPLMPDPADRSPFPEDYAPSGPFNDRARLRLDAPGEDVSIETHHGEPFQGPLEGREEPGFWSGVADVVGFPFRAVGWLVQSIF